MTPWDMAWMWVGMIMAIFAMSFNYLGDTYLFSFTERFYVGGTLGYTWFIIYNALMSNAVNFITSGSWWLIIPILIGLLSFTRLTKYRWLARYPVAIVSGIGVGLYFGLNLRASIIGPIITTIQNVFTGTAVTTSGDYVNAALILVMLIICPLYFLYSQRTSSPFHTKGKWGYYLMRLARLFMMMAWGYLGVVNLFSAGIVASLTNYFGIVKQLLAQWPPTGPLWFILSKCLPI
jgi:hypothetical protein